MMEFLRALAPSNAAAKTRAVPVVPSRFEDGRPLSQVPAIHVETLSQGFVADRRETAAPQRAISRLVEPVREDEAAPATRADRIVVTPTGSRATLSQVPEQLPVRAVPATGETAGRAAGVLAVPRPSGPPAFLRTAQQVSGPLQTAALPVGLALPEAAGSPPVRGPLSSGAVAAGTGSRSDTRPIIHVTIDRIDVRVPSMPERTSSRPRVRSNTSASLSDYLRSRPTPRAGGTS